MWAFISAIICAGLHFIGIGRQILKYVDSNGSHGSNTSVCVCVCVCVFVYMYVCMNIRTSYVGMRVCVRNVYVCIYVELKLIN
jgi:hypothetical protein